MPFATATALGQLTSSQLDTQLTATQNLLKQTDPDLMSPVLRSWIGELFGKLESETHQRKRIQDSQGVVSINSGHSPHDES
jgi:hypothetical protein